MLKDDLPISRVVFLTILAFIAGLALSPFFKGIYFLFLLPLLFLSEKRLVLILIVSFVFGIFYYRTFTDDEFILPLFEGEEIVFTGLVVEEDRNVVSVESFKDYDLSEKAYLHPEGDLCYGQRIKVKGRVSLPDDDFRGYFKKDGISVSIFDPEVEVLDEKIGWKSPIYNLRRRFQSKISRGLPFPQSAVLQAVLLGDRSEIPPDLQNKFSVAGVAHLLAVSGTHIVIISGLLVAFFAFLGFSYKYLLSLLFLALFILMIGAPPSAIRAGIMGSLFLVAGKFKRKSDSMRGLVFVALFMLLFNPRLLWNDVGFQLSFLAASGIILFSGKVEEFLTVEPVTYYESGIVKIKRLFSRFFSEIPDFIPRTLAVTLSAQVFVLPLIYYYFGNLPLISPLSNLVLAPLLPVIMTVGIASLALSFLIPEIVAFLPTFVLLRIVLVFVELFYELSVLW